MNKQELLSSLSSHQTQGLSTQEAKARLEKHGPNKLQEAKKKPCSSVFWISSRM